MGNNKVLPYQILKESDDWTVDFLTIKEELKNDEVIKSVLGEHTLQHFIKAKKIEWEDYKTKVHQWELDRYLNNY